MMKSNGKKKGFLAAVWESMTKTGGCCGSGESCGCGSQPDKNKAKNEKKNWDAAQSRGTNSSKG
jgi:hypothetical protein